MGAGVPLLTSLVGHLPSEAATAALATYTSPLLLALAGVAAGRRLEGTSRIAAQLQAELESKDATLADLSGELDTLRRVQALQTQDVLRDPLTKLANRALLENRADHALARADKKPADIAVLLLAFNDAAALLDTLGQALFDALLAAVGERFAALVRPSDTVARFEADGFAVLLESIPTAAKAAACGQRFIDALAAPIDLERRAVQVSVSVGIACSHAGASVETLLRDARLALTQAAASGAGGVRVHQSEQQQLAVLERLKLRGEIGRALGQQQFFLEYQPIVELRSQRVVGMEALVRWRHPQHDILPPLEFIKLAEDTKSIVPLGAWILRTACGQLAEWQRLLPTTEQLSITVNVSPVQLRHSSFIEDVRETLAATGVRAANLILELPEAALVDAGAETWECLSALKALGVCLAIDDFGTGCSALDYLQQFGFDILKIDQSLIAGAHAAFARTIVALGTTLKLRVHAEGIEETAQLGFLRDLGCELGHGFLFARPLDAASMSAFLEASSGGSATAAIAS